MSITSVPSTKVISDKEGRLTSLWESFFSSINYWLAPIGASGITANRPADSSRTQLYIGQNYFDSTLGKPIWVKSRNPTVWCDATGASV